MSEKADAVQRMQDYIGEHLGEDITLADLSRVSLYSPWYACRLFKECTGFAPADYIRRLRLSRSAQKLRDEKQSITDLAFELGFGSVDGYRRAFYREFGCNPRQYARAPVPLYLFIPYGAKFKELRKDNEKMENVQSVFVQLIEKPERRAIIKRGIKADDYFSYCEEVGCDVWGLLTSMDSLCGEPVCLWLPEKFRLPNTSEYVQGVETNVDYTGAVPEGFDIITLPQAYYLSFQGEPFKEEDYCDAISAVQTAMERYDPSVVGYCWDNDNPEIQLEPRGERGYIQLRAVKPL